jgi:hypothetical protein
MTKTLSNEDWTKITSSFDIMNQKFPNAIAAESDPEKNGVLWAVRGAKERELIESTKTQGFYKIIKL